MGNCKYCGLKAGILSKVHKECEDKHSDGLRGLEQDLRLILFNNNGDCTRLRLNLSTYRSVSFLSDDDIATVFDRVIRDYTSSLRRPYSPKSMHLLDDILNALSVPYQIVSAKGGLDEFTKKLMRGFMVDYFTDQLPLNVAQQRCGSVLKRFPMSQEQIADAYWHVLDKAASNFLSDGTLSNNEQIKITDYTQSLGLLLNNIPTPYQNGDISKLSQVALIKALQNGIVPKTNIQVPIILGKNESVLWAYSNVSCYQEKVTREWVGRNSVPFKNLIIINEGAVKVSDIFKYHEYNCKDLELKITDILGFKHMLQRYLDVTRSQLFFSNGCVLVEGVSEALLIECFAKKLGKSLTERQIEIVNMEGTAFYQFLLLFNSKDETLRLPFKIAVVTDGNQFTASKDFSLSNLIDEDKLEILREGINNSPECSRIPKLRRFSNNQLIGIFVGKKTFEYELCRANVCNTIEETVENSFFKFLQKISSEDMKRVHKHMTSLFPSGNLSEDNKMDVAILMWKACPEKSEMAQALAYEIETFADFKVPTYLREAINHLVE